MAWKAGRNLSRRLTQRRQETKRTVLANRTAPEELSDPPRPPAYVNNMIKTSKYTVLTFLPKNLFEQFRRLANFYFLLVAVIQVSIDSPVPAFTSVLPLIFVITVTAVKQAYEDWLRHREDNKVNNAPARVLRDAHIKDVRTQDIQVGDVVEVGAEQQFPCDLLLLTSSDPEGKCEVTTANLDGETNLKTFLCPQETQQLMREDELWSLRAVIECQLPHANLYDFKGRLEVYQGGGRPAEAPLATENLLLRGSRLKNTVKIYGLAIYTGQDTKMALNSKMSNSKFSSVEKAMNYFLLVFLAVLVVEIVVSTALKYQLYGLQVLENNWYFGVDNSTTTGVTGKDVAQDLFSFLIIYNYIIPISLYVTLEMQKFLGVMFMAWDDKLRCETTRERCKCNTSDLNEELGQVQYLFTDKTGTLTENMMNFRQCSVSGQKYVEEKGQLVVLDEENNNRRLPLSLWPESLNSFMMTLALCHTVQLSSSSNQEQEILASSNGNEMTFTRDYQASSPDEKALVEACARHGVVFEGQYKHKLQVTVKGEIKTFTRLQVLEFDSDRKCMSVVVQDEETGRIWLLTKGAESSILTRCSPADPASEQLQGTTLKHIDDYAMLGLRTLAVARRELSPAVYHDFSEQLNTAKKKLDGREEAVRLVMDKMEAELTLLGATGVEDLLQDGVQETLESLRVAGVKVWVLTGDKVETAINIAYSCGHFKKFMTILSLTGIKDMEQGTSKLKTFSEATEGDGNYGLVVDGASLQVLLDHMAQDFYRVSRKCVAVVCCRMSPRQKAETVRLIKTSDESPICAAIGDGANDVSMIQEAHVGLGVMGKEGRQAVRCSDFAFARFRFLKRVLLVHGHWYYVRVTTLVHYCFYKNVAFITPQVFYAIWNGFSTQSVYDSLALTMFNIVYTSLPIIVYGILDQNIPPNLLMDRPHLYKNIARNARMSWTNFFKWTLFGVWHSSVMYFGLMMACADDTCGLPGGQTSDLFLFGTTLVNICVIVTNLKLVLEARYMTWLFFGSMVLTAVGYVGLCLLYQGFLSDRFDNYGVYWTFYRMFESGSLLLTSLLLVVVCLVPDVLDQVYMASKDERAIDKRRRSQRGFQQASLKAYTRYVNEAFDPMEGPTSLWETTKPAQPQEEQSQIQPKTRDEEGHHEAQSIPLQNLSISDENASKNGRNNHHDHHTGSSQHRDDGTHALPGMVEGKVSYDAKLAAIDEGMEYDAESGSGLYTKEQRHLLENGVLTNRRTSNNSGSWSSEKSVII